MAYIISAVYAPKKTYKFGVKVWVLAEAATGYVLGFQVYTGAVLPDIFGGVCIKAACI